MRFLGGWASKWKRRGHHGRGPRHDHRHFCPRGARCPLAVGTIPEGTDHYTPLDCMSPGQRGRILGFTVDNMMSRRLIELGVIPGRSVIYLRDAPLQDPLEIKVGPCFLSLRRAEASIVAVQVDE